jgi:hypothetical protein
MRKPVGRIPKFISAASAPGLQRFMLQTQSKLGYGVEFFDIQFIQKQNKWFAWFYDNDDINLHNIEERLGNSTDSERNDQR